MAISSNTFSGGINNSIGLEYTNNNELVSALNAALINIYGSKYSLTPEPGNVILSQISTNYEICGFTVIDKDIVLFIVKSDNTESKISVLEYSGNIKDYIGNSIASEEVGKTILHSDIASGYKLSQNNLVLLENYLNFKSGSFIKATSKINYNNERIIYFIDDNNIPRTINLDRLIDYDSVNQEAFDAKTSLQIPNVSIPVITNLNVPQSNLGNLPSTVYQFVARYKTVDGITSNYGLVSNTIHIVDESEFEDSKNYDGCLPFTPTSKSIDVTISNISTFYKFLEVVVIYYEGLSSTFKAYKITEFETLTAISGTKVINFNNLDLTNDEVNLEEIVFSNVFYNRAKDIYNIDNTLLLMGLKTEEINEDFQTIANNIAIKLAFNAVGKSQSISILKDTDGSGNLKDIDTNDSGVDSFSCYANPEFASKNKTWFYREVYDFAFVPIFANGTFGNAYHIPGDRSVPKVNTSFEGRRIFRDASGGNLGTFWSEEIYPTGFNYPTDNGGEISFHLMPRVPVTNSGSPSRIEIKSVIEGAGVTLYNNLINSGKIKGYILVRQRRDTGNKGTIVCQGFGKRLITTEIGITPKSTSVEPALGQFYWDEVTGQPGNIAYTNGGTGVDYGSSNRNKRGVVFYSPDLVQNIVPRQSGNWLEYVGEHKQTSSVCANGSNIPANSVSADNDAGDKQYAFFIHGDSYILSTNNSTSYQNEIEKKIILSTQNVIVDENTVDSDAICKFDGTGDIFYSLKSELVERNSIDPAALRIDQTSGGNFAGTNEYYYDLMRSPIYNVINKNLNPYTNLQDAEYVYVGHKFSNELLPLEVDYNRTTGDTFFTKYGITINEKFYRNNNYVIFKGIFYAWFQSNANLDLRHYIQGVQGIGTIPYYPKEKFIYNSRNETPFGILNYSHLLGQSTGYNKQYSIENNINKYFPKTLTENVIRFDNRIIYSLQGVEGQLTDSWRVFLPNNYYDLTKKKGLAVKLFELNQRLFVATTNSIFELYYNSVSQQSTNLGQVVLGLGNRFSLPAKEVEPLDNYYGGQQGYFCGVNTPFGRIFFDTYQQKIFLFNGQGTKIISDKIQPLLNEYFYEVLPDIEDIRNPFVGYLNLEKYKQETSENAYLLIILTYDVNFNRVIFTFKNISDNVTNNKVKNLTFCYYIDSDSWLYNYEYYPYMYINFGTRLISIQGKYGNDNNSFNNNLYEHIGSELMLKKLNGRAFTCNFYGNQKTFEFEISVNKGTDFLSNGRPYQIGEDINKTFDSVKVNARIHKNNQLLFKDPNTTETGRLDDIKFFNEIQLKNYNINVTKTLVVDNSYNSFINNSSNNIIVKWIKQIYNFALPYINGSRIKSNYLLMKFIYNFNSVNNEIDDTIIVNEINTTFRKNQ